jgi:hypothetical protein
MPFAPKAKYAWADANASKRAMSAYSILMLRCPLFFKRRKYSRAEGLRLIVFDKLSLLMTGALFTAMPPLKV